MEFKCKSTLVYKKSGDILINKKNNNNKFEQSLNVQFFDPQAKSPPSLFVSKLHSRMNMYYEFKNDFKLTKA
jgi:hypothetical protein